MKRGLRALPAVTTAAGPFLLASLACSAALLVASCGGRVDTGSQTGAAATSIPTTTPPSKPTRPAQQPLPDEPTDNPNACPGPLAISEAQIENDIGGPFKGPPARMTACSEPDIGRFQNNLTIPNLTSYTQLEEGLSPDCVACIFTKSSDDAWGPVVLLDAGGTSPTTDGSGFLNLGACYASASTNMQCGRAFQYDQFCSQNACSDCLSSENYSKCLSKVGGSTCKASHDKVDATCDPTAASICGLSIVEHARYLCAL